LRTGGGKYLGKQGLTGRLIARGKQSGELRAREVEGEDEEARG